MYKVAIFDLDGTLVDTLQNICDAMNHSLEQFSLPTYPVEPYRHFVGDGLRALVERVAPDHPEKWDEIEAYYAPYLKAHAADDVDLYPGMADCLDALFEEPYKVAILTNKPEVSAMTVIEQSLKAWQFDCIVGQSHARPRKPDPASAFYICEQLNLKPEDCVYIGDTHTDMLTGKAAGMFTVGVLWGFRERAELEEHGADAIIDHPMQLVEIMKTA